MSDKAKDHSNWSALYAEKIIIDTQAIANGQDYRPALLDLIEYVYLGAWKHGVKHEREERGGEGC